MNLKDRVAVVTGAASGIGRALALSLARRGCHLALADIDEAGAQRTAADAQALGVRATHHRLDVANPEQIRAFAPLVEAAHGRVDLLFNVAGVALGGRFEQIAEADFDWLMDINFNGVVRMTRAFLPLLHRSDDARLVNISSLFGLVSPPGESAYSASKFAVRGFTNALRHELQGSTIAVTLVHPGGVATSIAKNARVPAGTPQEKIDRHQAKMEKLLRMPPERVAEAIVEGTLARRGRIVIGSDAKFVALLERLFPVNYWRVMKKVLG